MTFKPFQHFHFNRHTHTKHKRAIVEFVKNKMCSRSFCVTIRKQNEVDEVAAQATLDIFCFKLPFMKRYLKRERFFLQLNLNKIRLELNTKFNSLDANARGIKFPRFVVFCLTSCHTNSPTVRSLFVCLFFVLRNYNFSLPFFNINLRFSQFI